MEVEVMAAIIRENGKLLICRRGLDDDLPGLWEFPGGRLEPCESLEACIQREIEEELELIIQVHDIFDKTSCDYLDRHLSFTFFNATVSGGHMRLNVHEDAKWVYPFELAAYEFMPADVEIVHRLVREEAKICV